MKRTAVIIIFTLASCISGLSNTIMPASYAAEASNPAIGKIAFASTLDGDSDIYLMDADGTDWQKLTDNDVYDSYPSWSPDGKKIAFTTTTRDDNEAGIDDEICVMNSDGTNQRKLSSDGIYGFWPQWSPDGEKIAFLSIRDGERDLYVVNADGTNETRLTDEPLDESSPTWAPDSKTIAFARDGEIYIIDIETQREANLTNSPYPDSYPSWSSDGTKILFQSGRDHDDSNIYIMNSDGTDQASLSDEAGNGMEFDWSQKDDKIVFVSVGSTDLDIFVMDDDGSDRVNLTNSPSSDRFPAFQPMPSLPDNGKVVYTRTRDNGSTQLYTVNLDGTNVTRLSASLSASDSYPSWSPDGTKILFQSVRDSADSDIYVMDYNGKNETKVLQSALFDTHPSWSADGSKIVYAASGTGKDRNLYIIDSDGSDQVLLTDMAGDDSYPSFSPDGSQVAFSHYENGNYEIYVINTDGSDASNITSNTGDDSHPSWSPDGSKIVFESTRDNNTDIYAVDPDGTDLRRLTDDPAADFSPRWSADGTKITFARSRGGGDAEIYVMDYDGTDIRRLDRSSYHQSEPHLGALSATTHLSKLQDSASEEPMAQNATADRVDDNMASGLAVLEIRAFVYDADYRDYRPDEQMVVTAVHPGEPIVINSLIRNELHEAEHFDYAVQVTDSHGVTRALSIRQGVAVPLGHETPIDSDDVIVLSDVGTYTIKVFTLRNIESDPSPLSSEATRTIDVVANWQELDSPRKCEF